MRLGLEPCGQIWAGSLDWTVWFRLAGVGIFRLGLELECSNRCLVATIELEAEIWTSRLEFWLCSWRGGRIKEKEKEVKISYIHVWKHRSSVTLGPLPKNCPFQPLVCFLRSQICSLSPQIYPLHPQISPLRLLIYPLKLQVSYFRPQISLLRSLFKPVRPQIGPVSFPWPLIGPQGALRPS